jgi:hypothetical protein
MLGGGFVSGGTSQSAAMGVAWYANPVNFSSRLAPHCALVNNEP